MYNVKEGILIIAQITDTHILPKGQEWLCKEETEVDNRLRLVIEHLNSLSPQPDALLLTGDTIEKGGQEAYRYLKEILRPLSMPIYIIPGNHDDREEMRAAFSEKVYIPSEGFIQYIIDDYAVRLIGLDTHVPHQDYGLLCKQRLQWLEENLKLNPLKPTLIFMHHFPVKVGSKCFDNMICRMEGDFEKLIRSSRCVIGIVAGHYHTMCTTLFGGKVCFIAPSVAPTHYFATDEDRYVTAIDLTSPSFVLHRWGGGFQMVSESIQAVGFTERLYRKSENQKELVS